MVVMELWFSGNLKKIMKKIRLIGQSTTILHCFTHLSRIMGLFFSRTTCSYVIDFSPSFLHMGMKGVSRNPLKSLETITRHITVYIGYYKVTTIW